MARVEATVPEIRQKQLAALARDLGLSKSQVIEEAVALYLMAAEEAKRGLHLAMCDAETGKAVRELVTPSLGQLEWASQRKRVVLTDEEFDRILDLVENPPRPRKRLSALMAGSPKQKLAALLAARRG